MKKIFLMLFGLLLSLPALSQAQEGETIDKIVASVDNYIILLSEVEGQYLNLLSRGAITEGEASKCKVLEDMIIQKMMIAKAEIDSVIVEDKIVQRQLDQRMDIMCRQVGGCEKLEKVYGKTMNDIKNELRDIIHDQMVVQKMQEKITEKVTVTPKEVRKFFASIPKDSLEIENEVELSHIVKIIEPSKEQKRLTKERLEKIRTEIAEGKDFAEMAKKNSEDYTSAQQGGSLDWQNRGNLVPEYEAEVFRIKPNELSRVVESQFGFHLILLKERRGNEHLSSHILLKPTPDAQDIERTKRQLDSIRTLIMRDSIKFEKAAIEFSDDKNSGSSGGAILGNDRSTRIPVLPETLDSYLYQVIQPPMKVGEITEPLTYRTEDGKEAMRIILYKSLTDRHTASLKTDYAKIYEYALNEKKGKAIEEWFKKTKDQVLIRVDDRFKGCTILGLK